MAYHFIFGYGSLMEDASRMRTTPTARNAWPVEVKGFERGWWARGPIPGMTTTFLGAIKNRDRVINGVVYEVSKEEIEATDRREKGYQRVEIPAKDIKMLDGRKKSLSGTVQIYINKIEPKDIKDHLPSKKFPIVQSYLDICVNGALQVEGRYPSAAGFVKQFFKTTSKWSKCWVNDRVYPRRPFIFRPTAGQIDRALRAAPATCELVWDVEIEPASWEDRKPIRPTVEMKTLQPAADGAGGAASGPACWEAGG